MGRTAQRIIKMLIIQSYTIVITFCMQCDLIQNGWQLFFERIIKIVIFQNEILDGYFDGGFLGHFLKCSSVNINLSLVVGIIVCSLLMCTSKLNWAYYKFIGSFFINFIYILLYRTCFI